MTTQVPDFERSYFRFYLDFENRQVGSVSHKPPTRTNRVRVSLESVCRVRHRSSDRTTIYALSAACRTERVGAGRGELWIKPNAECIFLCSDDGQVGIFKNWHIKNPGVMLYPESLGPQPERQLFRAQENFDETSLDLRTVPAHPLTDFEHVADVIHGARPIVSRIEYADGDFDVRIEQPVKTINLAEKDRLHQTDTGPIILPDLCDSRLKENELEIGVFDLAFSAWNAPDWAEFVIRSPLSISDGVSVNHYDRTRTIERTRNTLLAVE